MAGKTGGGSLFIILSIKMFLLIKTISRSLKSFILMPDKENSGQSSKNNDIEFLFNKKMKGVICWAALLRNEEKR
jgi:hypothetical protein